MQWNYHILALNYWFGRGSGTAATRDIMWEGKPEGLGWGPHQDTATGCHMKQAQGVVTY